MINDELAALPFNERRSAEMRALLADLAEKGSPENTRFVRRRRVAIVVPAVIGVLVLTAGALVVAHSTVSDKSAVTCVARAEKNFWGEMPGTRVTMLNADSADGSDGPVPINDALATCSDLWAQHLLDASIPSGVNHDPVDRAFSYPVPSPLSVCVMSDGTAAVIPGPESACASLGFSPARGEG